MYENVLDATESVPLGNSVYKHTYLILDPIFYDHKKLVYNKREEKAVSDLNHLCKYQEKNPR